MKNNDKVILSLAYFLRYGIIALAILPFLIGGIIGAICLAAFIICAIYASLQV